MRVEALYIFTIHVSDYVVLLLGLRYHRMSVLNCLPIRSSAGLKEHHRIGVVLKLRSARRD